VAVREHFENLTLLDQHAFRQYLGTLLARHEFARAQ
jgi:hypothetical protein